VREATSLLFTWHSAYVSAKAQGRWQAESKVLACPRVRLTHIVQALSTVRGMRRQCFITSGAASSDICATTRCLHPRPCSA